MDFILYHDIPNYFTPIIGWFKCAKVIEYLLLLIKEKKFRLLLQVIKV